MALPVRLAVVDEHEIFRRGLVACLAEDPAIDLVASLSAGPLAMEVDLAVVSATVARSTIFSCPLVVCGRRPVEYEGQAALNVVLGSVPRSTLTIEQLIASVRAAAVGLRVDAHPEGSEADARLDDRGLMVLRLLAEGAHTREIAASLSYSERTIKGLIQQVQRCLGARTRAEAVAMGIRQGII